jgi:hypothetical protein
MKMNHTCSKVLIAVLGIGLWGCDNASNPTAVSNPAPILRAALTAASPNATIKFTDSFPFSFFDNCTGDTVSGVVAVKTTVHFSADASGGLHAHFHDVFNGRAVGEPSGTSYVGPQTDHDGFSADSGGAFEETFTLNFRFISQGSADNILTHVLFHVTVNANGVVTSETATVTDACTG